MHISIYIYIPLALSLCQSLGRGTYMAPHGRVGGIKRLSLRGKPSMPNREKSCNARSAELGPPCSEFIDYTTSHIRTPLRWLWSY